MQLFGAGLLIGWYYDRPFLGFSIAALAALLWHLGKE